MKRKRAYADDTNNPGYTSVFAIVVLVICLIVFDTGWKPRWEDIVLAVAIEVIVGILYARWLAHKIDRDRERVFETFQKITSFHTRASITALTALLYMMQDYGVDLEHYLDRARTHMQETDKAWWEEQK